LKFGFSSKNNEKILTTSFFLLNALNELPMISNIMEKAVAVRKMHAPYSKFVGVAIL
jgi:hypothetical protein